MENIIIAFSCIIDDLLEKIGHREDSRRIMSDAEVITTALVAARLKEWKSFSSVPIFRGDGYEERKC